MVAVNYSTIRSKLKDYCDKATDENETVIVTRKDEKNVVLMSLESYNELIKSVKNVDYIYKIDKSMEQIEKGKTVTKSLEELEAMENE
ncbi:MAG: type II toxin-antitoxin system Phd/YefM family antitoxin [Clostridia bacterium]|nr:type II toxin-antitoxin system Phd/YefM family antitoxin [Clostridia bacterium]